MSRPLQRPPIDPRKRLEPLPLTTFSAHARRLFKQHWKENADGSKPICGPCRRHPKEDECEYSDGPGRSRTKALEEQVLRLEARLQELENPEATTPSVKLHDPYAQYHETQRLSRSPPIFIPQDTAPFAPLSPFSPTSTSSSLPSGRHWNTFSALKPDTEPTGSSGSSSSPLRHNPFNSPFLGAEVCRGVDKFLPHAAEFGFFLHKPTFRANALLSPSFRVVYLWGVHLGQSEALLREEPGFLIRAVQHTATDLLGTHPNRVLHTLQAQVLLAYYFFRTGRFLEAKGQTGAAISLSLGSGFHKLRSTNVWPPTILGLFQDTPLYLDHPQTALDEGERINAFWAVFVLHKIITVALEPPANVCGALEAPGIQIDVPWPLETSAYAEGTLMPESSSTVRSFLGGADTLPLDADSISLMVTKASILFHRSAHLTGHWSPNMGQREFQAFAAGFQTVNRLIETFRSQLPPISTYRASDPAIRTLILTHALTDAATIKLHGIFAYADSASKQHCLTAARSVSLQEVGYLNPIMGTLWMSACHVFIDEVSRLRMPASWPQSPTGEELTEEGLMEYLRNGINALSLYSEDNVLTRYQLTKVQEAFNAI
ncbi:hypothetical protein DFP72DRAFT_987787 [Ephemerocybe angulata]|uniref:Transcription factor domain-containing protein n=1 Tax=Ephemerocybe angulata TaxID=980116 RepID=A0A8H6ICB4_9AGAR|nr:hypothetical protein DFP72DRAFT_987787 [Tulosesus angulatus]